jgi:hypothetical protein
VADLTGWNVISYSADHSPNWQHYNRAGSLLINGSVITRADSIEDILNSWLAGCLANDKGCSSSSNIATTIIDEINRHFAK